MSVRFVDNSTTAKRVPLKSLYGAATAFQGDDGDCYIVTNERNLVACTCLCVSGDCAGRLYQFHNERMVTPVDLVITRVK